MSESPCHWRIQVSLQKTDASMLLKGECSTVLEFDKGDFLLRRLKQRRLYHHDAFKVVTFEFHYDGKLLWIKKEQKQFSFSLGPSGDNCLSTLSSSSMDVRGKTSSSLSTTSIGSDWTTEVRTFNYEASRWILSIEGNFHLTQFITAFAVLFAHYYIFNIEHQESAACRSSWLESTLRWKCQQEDQEGGAEEGDNHPPTCQ